MGSIMRGCLKVRLLLLLSLLLFLPVTVWATNDYATTLQAQVELQGNDYVLNAEINYHLSPAAKEALLKGIALSWTIPVVLQQHRDYLWDQEILRLTLRYQVQYFALLNVYRVRAEHSGQVSHFASFTAALDAIALIRSLKLIDKNQLPAKRAYQVKLKVGFDREALPIPLRPIAYFDPQWFLSSDWVVCKF
jgi:hypothetical protein